MSLHIAVLGYGKTGSLIADIAHERGHTLTIIDPGIESGQLRAPRGILVKSRQFAHITAESMKEVDVAIDFTTPSSALPNTTQLMECRIPTVMGTTGWYEQLKEIRALVTDTQGAFLYAHNFSLGVALYYEIARKAAQLFNAFPEYDVAGLELHHNEKKDSPSGTAEALGEILLQELERKSSLVRDRLLRAPEHSELHMASVRCGSVPGTHQVFFDSPADTITLTHEARNRTGFALGAVRAAEWLADKQGFFTLQDMLTAL